MSDGSRFDSWSRGEYCVRFCDYREVHTSAAAKDTEARYRQIRASTMVLIQRTVPGVIGERYYTMRTWRRRSCIASWSEDASYTSMDPREGRVTSTCRRSCPIQRRVPEFPKSTTVGALYFRR